MARAGIRQGSQEFYNVSDNVHAMLIIVTEYAFSRNSGKRATIFTRCSGGGFSEAWKARIPHA